MFAYTRGYYGEPNDIAERMWDYAQKNYLEFSGPVYNLFLLDEISITDRSQYLLQASVRVTKV
jgi:effector-binding domain-containing protein